MFMINSKLNIYISKISMNAVIKTSPRCSPFQQIISKLFLRDVLIVIEVDHPKEVVNLFMLTLR